MIKFIKQLLLIVCVILYTCTIYAKNNENFHKPTTAQEKRLHEILQLASCNYDLIAFLLKLPKYKPIDYSNYLTNKLALAIETYEKNLVQKTCNGKYLDDQICGINYNPITCSQESFEFEVYNTIKTNNHETTIEYSYLLDNKIYPIATYRLVNKLNIWLLDGIKCNNYLYNDNYNF